MQRINPVMANLALQRGHLFYWSPVCLALGIGIYFSIRFEPSAIALWAAAACAGLGAFSCRFVPENIRPVPGALCLILGGFALAGIRSHSVEAPVLGWRYYGVIEGRIISLDKSASDALRLTLDQVSLGKISAKRTPKHVRISLHDSAAIDPQITPGAYVKTTGYLSPPSGPVEPAGFDFQRHAWFLQLGAVGYTRQALQQIAPPSADWKLWLFQMRMTLSKRINANLTGDIGGFASAITTGDRSGISDAALQALRISNIAHLLAISGLHMGLLSGFVFALLRIVLIYVPHFGARAAVHKWAALGALFAALMYLGLSGGNVATQRAFVMVAVALSAVMLNRRAISLRAVAIAALIILIWRPESLLGAGFQMSFAATTALVVVFEQLRERQLYLGPSWLRPVVMLCISSLVAGLATAPIAAAHFNTVSYYGLIANLLSLPVMGMVIVPSAVLAFLLMPIGGEGIGLWIMGKGVEWILSVANWVASFEGARGYVIEPAEFTVAFMMLGLLWLVLWKGRPRLLGLGAVVFSLWMWISVERPDVLISQNGGLVGLMTPQGRALSKERGAGFVAQNWLRSDGDGRSQQASARLWRGDEKRIRVGRINGAGIQHVIGKKALGKVTDCANIHLLISSVPLKKRLKDCQVLDPKILRSHGSIAIHITSNRARIVSAREKTGNRIWSAWPEDIQTPLPTLEFNRSE